jgi:signal transduction histidine kinase
MLPLVAVAAASLLAVGAIHARLAARQTRQQIEQQLQGVVRVLTGSSFPLSDAVLRQMRDLSRAEFLLADASGRALASSFDSAPRLPATTMAAATDGDRLALGPPLELDGRRYFHTTTALSGRPGQGDAEKLHILFPEDEYRRTWREAFLPSLAVGAATLLVAAVVARVLAGRVSRATSRLGADVLRMARGDFAPADLPVIDDEIRDLSLAVNQTAGMLADYERQVRHTEKMRTVSLLSAGLAHEMRNAATGCRMALDLHALACNGHGDGESLAVAKRQLQLMETQLQRLLRAGGASGTSGRSRLDLAELIEGLLPLVRPAAQHAGVEVAWRRPAAPVWVEGDGEALIQLALNLMLNAIEAARQPAAATTAEVRIELRATDSGDAELTISDTGPGPEPRLSATLFEPFVTSKPEGIGLGLAVARQVAAGHGGGVRWRRRGEWTEFCAAIPLQAKGEFRV